MMSVGSTSKTCNPRAHGQFLPGVRKRRGLDVFTRIVKPMEAKAEKYFSSAASDTSEASTAGQQFGSIDESGGDIVRDWHARASRH